MSDLKGFSLPRTPLGRCSLAPNPPWYYVANALAIEYRVEAQAAASFLPPGLKLRSDSAAVYFADWQSVTEHGEENLDPVRSQYRETIFLLSAELDGEAVAFCPFIWVDQDVSLMRGLVAGWPKQIGSVWITRSYELPSKASPNVGEGGNFGATLAVKDRRFATARVKLREKTSELPTPDFARAVNVRYFPDLSKGNHGNPLVHDLVQLKSRDVQIGEIWKGDADLEMLDDPSFEVSALRPLEVIAGYRFSFAFTVDDILVLKRY
ncbi:acetoacetate decarboxylase [Burkholderia sp. THE68]|uniref:acetoacetate decarboxylase family protein n=1 Tax=Burkholderia sp. THE68 TaxID=758782 RepID=UPI001316828D|nr:acetoacetate decarboxylase family protein [Burkholderia sp. THE68]BBU30320.1 acetoacetate decarboxylase [Burkholderia sp. THE68]